jgi:phage-related protein
VLGIIGSFAPSMAAKGAQMIAGLVTGIRNAAGKVWEAIKSVVSGAISRAASLLDINSPSLVFAGMGGSVSEGFAKGITDNARLAANASRKMALAASGTSFQAGLNRISAPRGFGGPVPSLARGGGTSSTTTNTNQSTIHAPININGARDPKSVAREVGRELDRRAYGSALKSNK